MRYQRATGMGDIMESCSQNADAERIKSLSYLKFLYIHNKATFGIRQEKK